MDYRSILTTCSYCGCGCGLYLEVLEGRMVGTMPCKTSPLNEGKLCVKGWNIHEFIHSPKRLTLPLMRKNGALVPVTWDEALDFTATRLREIRDANGSDSIAFLSSAKVTNEENYLVQKFARAAVGTNNVDHCARL
jgi:predicted molibdopterin-dependent oxidoreductase YjgC